MRKIERITLGFILGAISPIIGFLAFWWSSILFFPERWIFVWAILGLMVGLTVDFVYLKNWISKAYDYDLKIWMSIYVFYSICILGFFMGIPVFNVVLAVPAGFLIGCILAYRQAEITEYQRLAGQTCRFTTIVLALICLVSATIAMNDPYTSANLEGMFHLGFKVTSAMIVWIILLGGATLLGMQWWITSRTIHLVYRWAHKCRNGIR